MDIKKELVDIVGSENFSDSADKLQFYSKDNSLCKPVMPGYLVQPKDVAEVQQIVKAANNNNIPLIPCSSGIHFYGNTIPVTGAIMLELKRLNKILDVNEINRTVRIEPGVTWGLLQAELAKRNSMALAPLLPHARKSVVSSHLEREPMLIPKFEYAESLITLECVSPEGEIFRSGSACVPGFPDSSMAEGVNPGGPGNLTWSWLLQGAQGTLGVVTWAQIKIEPRPKVNKTFLIPFDRLEDAAKLVSNIQRRMIGEECLILNNLNLAAILSKVWPEDFKHFRQILPPWTVILVSGGWRRPEEKIEYEEDGLREAIKELALPDLAATTADLLEAEKNLPDMLRTAWPEDKPYWKFAYHGNCQDLFFVSTLNQVPPFIKTISQLSAKRGYKTEELGFYIQPLEYGRACHIECNFYHRPDDSMAISQIRDILTQSVAPLIDMGAFFTRPNRLIADQVFARAEEYTAVLNQVKRSFDPNNIMSPGRLCF